LKSIFSVGLTALLFAGCAFTPSRLNAGRASFDGATVVVRGFVKLDAEVQILCESEARYSEYQKGRKSDGEKYCVTIANPQLLYTAPAAFDAKTLVVQGKFVANYSAKGVTNLGMHSLSTAIVIDNAALARRYGSLIPKR
jgi:hypothetical protein